MKKGQESELEWSLGKGTGMLVSERTGVMSCPSREKLPGTEPSAQDWAQDWKSLFPRLHQPEIPQPNISPLWNPWEFFVTNLNAIRLSPQSEIIPLSSLKTFFSPKLGLPAWFLIYITLLPIVALQLFPLTVKMMTHIKIIINQRRQGTNNCIDLIRTSFPTL